MGTRYEENADTIGDIYDIYEPGDRTVRGVET
jgi:hypothetical protein